MKKFVVLLLFALCGPALGQSVDLSVKGDGVSVVKVDKIVVIKEDLTLVRSFPFTVNAPTGAGLYFWTFPAGVQATDLGDTLRVSDAPKGRVTISVKSISAKLDAGGKFIGFLTQFGSVTFAVGDVPGPTPPPIPPPIPPEPPIPVPEPTDAFYQSLKSGWLKDAAADKAARSDLAAIYSQSVTLAKEDKTLTTAKQLFDRMHAARLTLVKEALPNTRAAITAYLDANLPRSITAPLDDATRGKAAFHFDLISKHLMRLP